jgi:2-polyprenyl-3-methyl-5-hydroxy-6-metoxy-1,4-benzoquinol methylase
MIRHLFRRPDRVAHRVFGLFRDAGRGDRLHLRVRWASCPIAAVEAEVPTVGRVLEVGCGHGLVAAYLALACRSREVVGVDIDERKLVVARAAAARLDRGEATLRYVSSADGAVPAGPWDAVVIVDVLYLLDADQELALLDACLAELAPGGVLVVKEADVTPRLKHALATAQEVLATRVLRITKGDALSFTPIRELAEYVAEQGFDVALRRVDAGYLHPHCMMVARRSLRER